MDYDNTNKGCLFRNDRKTEDKHPDYQGSINIDGVEYWLSGWKKRIKSGEKAGQGMMSLAVTPKEGGQRGGGPQQRRQNNADDIPF